MGAPQRIPSIGPRGPPQGGPPRGSPEKEAPAKRKLLLWEPAAGGLPAKAQAGVGPQVYWGPTPAAGLARRSKKESKNLLFELQSLWGPTQRWQKLR